MSTTKIEEGTRIRGLHPTTPERLSFAPSLEVRSFLLERARGNLLIYNSPRLADDADRLKARGEIARLYLNHGHEAMFGRPPAGLVGRIVHHVADEPSLRDFGAHTVSFDRRQRLDEDFEVIPIPGHTPGATAYLWDSGEHRLLFTGDTIYLDRGEWRAGLLQSSDRERFLQSLELIAELDFDVLVPWAASVGEPYLSVADEAGRRERIEAMVRRIRSAERG